MSSSFVAVLTLIPLCCDASSFGSRVVIPVSDRLRNRLEGLPAPLRVTAWVIDQHPSLQVASEHSAIFEGCYQKRGYEELAQDERQRLLGIVSQIPGFCMVEVKTGPISNYREAEQKAERYRVYHPGSSWTGEWNTSIKGETSVLRIIRSESVMREDLSEYSTIWQQSGRNNYLISCPLSNCKHETLWVVCSENQVLWLQSKVKRDEVPKPNKTFPELIRYEHYV